MMRCSCHGLHGCVPARREAEAERIDERAELRAPLAQRARRLGERLAAARADLDLGGDQLADEVRLELGAARRLLHVLEAVDEPERRRIDERELLLDRERQVRPALEGRLRGRQQLLVADSLLVAHGGSLSGCRLVLDPRQLLGERLHLRDGDGRDADRQPEREEPVDERREERRREGDADGLEREREPCLHPARAACRQRQRRDDVRSRVREHERREPDVAWNARIAAHIVRMSPAQKTGKPTIAYG